MTLQVVLGGSDGILIATDTKRIGSPFGMARLGEPHRVALEQGKSRSPEYGAEKILFNERRTVAVAFSGPDTSGLVARAIVGELEAVWGEYTKPMEDFCVARWKELPDAGRAEAVGRGDNTLILVQCGKPRVLKLRFQLDTVELSGSSFRKAQRSVVLAGDTLNPSGFFLERFLPQRPPSITKLAQLAAHYIRVAGELNPAGVGGLTMYFSKEGAPFQEISEDVISDLCERSERLNRRVQKALLRAVSF